VLPAGPNTLSVTFTPSDTTDYISATATVQLTVNPVSQTITFPAIADQTLGTGLPLGATASSGLPVSFASLTPSVCLVSGAWVSVDSTGSCTVQATQAGSGNYLAAAPVSQTFSVSHSTKTTGQTIGFSPIATQIAGATVNLSATASSGLTVSFQTLAPSVCTVSGTTASLVAYGTCFVQATQGGNSQYYAAPTVSQGFGVAHATQTINFPAIATQTAAMTINLQATASSGLPVTFTSTTPSVCTVTGSTASLVAYGFCGINASQDGDNLSGNSEYFAAVATQEFGVAHASQTITFTSIPQQYIGTPLSLTAAASSGLIVTYASLKPAICSVSGSTVTMIANGICNIEAMQSGNNEFLGAAPVIQAFEVTER
jgi:hypothetical protein